MFKFASRFILEKICPSVIATVAGAYIVNHYIVNKPADAPPVAVEAKVDSRIDKAAVDKAAGGASDGTRHVANIPEAGVRAKGLSEKAVERTPVEKVIEKAARPAEAERQVEEPKRHPQVREKTVAKVTPAETVSNPDERRDATDLARAAIERLRGTNESERSRDAAPRPPQPPRVAVQETPQVVPSSVQPLPPAIMVSAPPVETADPQSEPEARYAGRRRPVPPADIPEGSRPLDLQAQAEIPAMRKRDTTVADDVLSAAKSVFQAVLPR